MLRCLGGFISKEFIGRVISHLYRDFIVAAYPTLSASSTANSTLVLTNDNDVTRRYKGSNEC